MPKNQPATGSKMPSSNRPLSPTPNVGTLPSEDGGRTCGCDPRAKHVCEQHAKHVDTSSLEIRTIGGLVAISGPLPPRGTFDLHVDDGGSLATIELGRFQAEDLAYELYRRLAARE